MSRIVMYLGLVAVLLLGAVPAQAIINGAPDGSAHPNVGAMIIHFGDIDAYSFWCSGTLVTPTIFLTAAHCSPEFFDDFGLPPEWQTTLAGVAFDSELHRATTPLIPATAADFVRHPDYDVGDTFGSTPDLAVIHLAEPATNFYPGISPVELPAAGQIDGLLSKPAFRQQLLTEVGYGAIGVTHGGGPPQPVYAPVRKSSSHWLRKISASHSYWAINGANYFITTAHPGGPDGDGGSACHGDSGGPFFLGDATSNVQVGVLSGTHATGPDGIICSSPNFVARLDTDTVRSFLCGQGVSAACQDNTKTAKGKHRAKHQHHHQHASRHH